MARVATKKDGFREIGGMRFGEGGDWAKETDPVSLRTTWTSLNNNAKAVVAWGPSDTQTHGEPGKEMKPGSTIVEWTDANGIHHAEIERVE